MTQKLGGVGTERYKRLFYIESFSNESARVMSSIWKVDGDLQVMLTKGIDVWHRNNERRVGYTVRWVDVRVENADQLIEYTPSFGFCRWHVYTDRRFF